MVGSRGLRFVTAVSVAVLGAHATQDSSLGPPSLSSTGPFFSQSHALAGSHETLASFMSILSPDEQGAVAIDRDWIWQRYYGHLMSFTRATPFVVYFTDDQSDCDARPSQGIDDNDDEENATDDAAIRHNCHALRNLTAAVSTHLATVIKADSFPSPTVLPVVHISTATLPQALIRHRVPSTPSLMWFPPRSTGKLQRFAHPQINFLAFTEPIDATSVGRDVASFLQRSYAQSNLVFPTSNTRAYAQPVAALEDTLAASILHALPALAIVLYVFFLAFDNRVVVLRVLRRRSTWLVLSQFVLYVSFSGLFHSIIHRVAAFYFHPHFGLYLIHPSGRKQFFLEGLVNGTWNFVISFSLWSVASVLPTVQNKFARDEILRWALMFVGAAYFALHMVFMAKHPWLSR